LALAAQDARILSDFPRFGINGLGRDQQFRWRQADAGSLKTIQRATGIRGHGPDGFPLAT